MAIEEERRRVNEDRRKLRREQREFERHKTDYRLKMDMEKKRLKQKEDFLKMKEKILMKELEKLAFEKRQFELQKDFYRRIQDNDEIARSSQNCEPKIVRGEMFFTGVGNRQSLKKRYKELLKIYHPDNADGDNSTVVEINREYDQLSKKFM